MFRRNESYALGIDISTRQTGVVVVPLRLFGLERQIRFSSICSGSFGLKLEQAATQKQQQKRISEIIRWIDRSFLSRYDIRAVAVENYAFGLQSTAFANRIVELTGCLKRHVIVKRRIRLEVPHASQARKVLLGYAPSSRDGLGAAKPRVIRALRQIGFRFGTEDEYDALVVANWMVAELGHTAIMSTDPNLSRDRPDKSNRKGKN